MKPWKNKSQTKGNKRRRSKTSISSGKASNKALGLLEEFDSIIERFGHGSDKHELKYSKPIDANDSQFTSSQRPQASFNG